MPRAAQNAARQRPPAGAPVVVADAHQSRVSPPAPGAPATRPRRVSSACSRGRPRASGERRAPRRGARRARTGSGRCARAERRRPRRWCRTGTAGRRASRTGPASSAASCRPGDQTDWPIHSSCSARPVGIRGRCAREARRSARCRGRVHRERCTGTPPSTVVPSGWWSAQVKWSIAQVVEHLDGRSVGREVLGHQAAKHLRAADHAGAVARNDECDPWPVSARHALRSAEARRGPLASPVLRAGVQRYRRTVRASPCRLERHPHGVGVEGRRRPGSRQKPAVVARPRPGETLDDHEPVRRASARARPAARAVRPAPSRRSTRSVTRIPRPRPRAMFARWRPGRAGHRRSCRRAPPRRARRRARRPPSRAAKALSAGPLPAPTWKTRRRRRRPAHSSRRRALRSASSSAPRGAGATMRPPSARRRSRPARRAPAGAPAGRAARAGRRRQAASTLARASAIVASASASSSAKGGRLGRGRLAPSRSARTCAPAPRPRGPARTGSSAAPVEGRGLGRHAEHRLARAAHQQALDARHRAAHDGLVDVAVDLHPLHGQSRRRSRSSTPNGSPASSTTPPSGR